MVKTQISLLITLFLLNACGSYDAELEKIPPYMALTKTVGSQPTFRNFPPMSAWRLLIDGRSQSKGPMVFDEKEPGYLAGLSQGLDYALKNKDAPFHPFNDGNVRTFVLILLQKELARTGRTPVILYDPNRFDAFSVAELMEEMKEGESTFKDYAGM